MTLATLPRTVLQPALFCPCGRDMPAIAGLCRFCYGARARSRARFAGHRELVLVRDGGACRGCGAGETARRLHVHHRKPGFHELDSLVSLCAACHARVHRLAAVRWWVPEPLIELWSEQHPGRPVQLQFSTSAG